MRYKKYRGFTILNEPQKYSFSDYEEVKEKCVNIFKQMPSLVSIYQIGAVANPGISDLDIVLVFDDNVRGIDYRDYYKKFDNRDIYILMHSPFVITKNIFENMRYFYIPGNFKLLYGRDFQIKEIPYVKILERIIVTEFLLCMLFAIMHSLQSKIIKVRSLLCALNAIKYDFEICGLHENNFPKGWQLINAISYLREGWFELSEKIGIEEFVNTLEGFPDILFTLLSFIDEGLIPFGIENYYKYGGKLKFGINEYVTISKSNKCKFFVKENFIVSIIEKLPYSKMMNDTSWVLSNYIIKIPARLFSLLSGNVNSNSKPILNQRNIFIENYLGVYKNLKGFGMLLPTIIAPLPVLNLKWRVLIALRNLVLKNRF